MKTRKKPRTKLHHWLASNPLRKHIDALDAHGGAFRLAREIGCSTQTLYAWMAGNVDPSLANLCKIEEITGIKPSELLQWKHQKPKGLNHAQKPDLRDPART